MGKKRICSVVFYLALACFLSTFSIQGVVGQNVEKSANLGRSGTTDPANSVTGQTARHVIQDVGKFVAPPTHASVPYSRSVAATNKTMPEQINPNYHYSNEPAPMGISDLGINPNTNTYYTYSTTSFIGNATINSLSTSGGTYSGWAGIQLNVILKFQARSSIFFYWLQDVVQINENSGYPGYPNQFDFLDNIWNMSSTGNSLMSSSGLTGSGSIGTSGSNTYYYFQAPSSDDPYISYPNPMQLEINSTEINYQPVVTFAFNVGNGWVTFDQVTFKPGAGPLQDWNLVVDGSNYVPYGWCFADAEFVLCGAGNSATTSDMSSDLSMALSYYNGNNMQFIPFQYDFGSNTAETISNVYDALHEYTSGGAFYVQLTQGSAVLGHFTWVPATGRFSIPGANGGTFYIGNSPDSSVLFNGQYAQVTIYPGTYTISIGNWGNTYTFSTGINPVITLPFYPSVPASLSASYSNGAVNLTWSTPSSNGASITSYKIYRSISSGAETYLCTVFQTSYTDNSVTAGNTYFYEITAFNGVGEGTHSDESSAYVPVNPPSAPSSLSASYSGGAIHLIWNTPLSNGGATITSYNVYRGSSSGSETFLVKVYSIGYTDNGVNTGQTCYYQVSAINSAGEGLESSETSASMPAISPGVPLFLSGSYSSGAIHLMWSAPASNGGAAITSYNIYRGITPGSESFLVKVYSIDYTDNGVIAGQTFYYQVSAINSAGEGLESSESSASMPAISPGAPLSVSASYSGGEIHLTWSAPSSNGGATITSYKIYRGSSSGGEVYLCTVNTTSFVDSSTAPETPYYYTITAVNGAGEGSRSNEIFTTGTITPASSSGTDAWEIIGIIALIAVAFLSCILIVGLQKNSKSPKRHFPFLRHIGGTILIHFRGKRHVGGSFIAPTRDFQSEALQEEKEALEWMKSGKLELANYRFVKLCQEYPDNAKFHFNHALVLYKLKKYNDSLGEVNKGLLLKPKDEKATSFKQEILILLSRSKLDEKEKKV